MIGDYELKRLAEAPTNGQMLVYTRKKVIFKPYDSIATVEDELTGLEILEMHLFDKEKEYRYLTSDSPRFSKEGVIEHIADFPADDKESTYLETVQLEDENNKIKIINHISYSDENGMAVIDDYRLCLED